MEVGVFEARNRFSELLDAAERGEEVVVLRRGKPVVRIVGFALTDDRRARAERRREALGAVDQVRTEVLTRLGRTFTHEDMIAARDEGRR